MVSVFKMLFVTVRLLAGRRTDLVFDNIALRQQVAVLKRERPRPPLTETDRAFWVAMRAEVTMWTNALVIVMPETVVRWHKIGFGRWWRWKSKSRSPGRPRVSAETRALIGRMALDNGWRASRIHKEIALLGIDVSEVTVRKYVPRQPTSPSKLESWKRFLRLHANDICAMDFFVVPSVNFRLLYGFFVIHHGTRQILHFNVTQHPTAQWVIQQLREAFPWDTAHRYLICDNDTIFSPAVTAAAKSMGAKLKRTAYRSPWQNGVAERWIGICRREMHDHVIVLGENHLRRLGKSYVAYYNDDRPHGSLQGKSPRGRVAVVRPSASSEVVALSRVNSLHNRYEWRDAA